MMRTASARIWLAAVAILLGLTSCTGGRDNSLRVYDIGTRLEAGHIIYTVFETQWLPQLGTGDAARVPKNRFFVIRLSAVNSGSDDLYVPNMTLQDDQGNSFEELQDGEGVAQWVGYLRKVKPADSISGNVVFDAPPKHYRLRVADENGQHAALVDIPLSFGAETPQLPLPGGAGPGGGTTDFSSPGKN
jgi:hypothetical protein